MGGGGVGLGLKLDPFTVFHSKSTSLIYMKKFTKFHNLKNKDLLEQVLRAVQKTAKKILSTNFI